MTGDRALVIGGYGGFGARLSRRLAADGWHVVVAGRSAAKAEAFAATLPCASGAALDRNGPLGLALARIAPRLVIDAAGPFQDSSYRVVEACVALGIHYLDLADARAFVTGIAAFDAQARAGGVSVVSGASSVPALSGAVLRELTQGLDRVDRVDLAISASDRATAGTSVAAAILGYSGLPVRLWDGEAWTTRPGWSGVRHQRYALPEVEPLSRLVAVVDVPDHDLVPSVLPGRPATTFRAGPEFGFQLAGIWILSWLVRWGWIGSLVPMAPFLRKLQRLTAFLCSDRSAMMVEVEGQGHMRRWTLIADHGDGPEVPVLAAQLLARRIAEGTLPFGASHAGDTLDLADFAPLFRDLSIKTGIESPC